MAEPKYIKLVYADYQVLRSLMQEIDENEEEEDRLTTEESAVLTKINQIITTMERVRAEEKAGLRKVVYERGRRRVVRAVA